jgi:uncharacterized repeat protein (TIGR02543 family)
VIRTGDPQVSRFLRFSQRIPGKKQAGKGDFVMGNTRKRRFSLGLSIVLALALIFTMTPVSASATDTQVYAATDSNVYVSFSDGEFPLAKAQVKARPGLAGEYGYAYGSGVESDDITALDAIVAANIALHGADKQDVNDNLVVSEYGFITAAFGYSDGNFGVFVNGEQPVDKLADKIPESAWGPESYLMLAVNQAVINPNDHVQFYHFQDSYGMDNYVWFEKDGKKTSEILAASGETINLVAKGFVNWYCSAVDPSGFIKPIENAAFASVEINSAGGWNAGAFGAPPLGISGADGKLTFTAPEAPGVYYYSAYDKSGAAPLLAPWLEVTVTAKSGDSDGDKPAEVAKTATVKFNANGGKVKKASKKVTLGGKYGALPTPTKNLKDFKGWYTKKSGGVKVTANTKVAVSKNTTLYARWANAKAKVVKCAAANLRKGSGVSYGKTSFVKKGKTVEVLAQSGAWYKVKSGDKTGWIYGKYIGK